MAAKLSSGEAVADDFLMANSQVELTRAELAGMLTAGEMRLVPPGPQLSAVWPRAWSLMEDAGKEAPVGDGTDVWWLATQCTAGGGGGGADGTSAEEQLAAAASVAPSSQLADEAHARRGLLDARAAAQPAKHRRHR